MLTGFNKSKYPAAWVGLLAAALFAMLHHSLLWPVGGWQIGTTGDGIKNYFTAAWYLRYDHGLWFTGMHYPYGDHILFTDNQPLFSWLLSVCFPHAETYNFLPWIWHVAILVSFAACAAILFLILRRWISNPWLATVGALLITLLHPQNERMLAHFSLAYPVFIPLLWWLLLRFEQQPSGYKIPFAISLVLLLFAGIHLYYLLISIFFICFWLVAMWWYRKEQRRMLIRLLPVVVLPVVLFFVFSALTDPVPDRPSVPYGFFEYRASFQSIYIPRSGWLHDWWFTDMQFTRASAEGYAWMGYAGLFVLALVCVRLFRRALRRQTPFDRLRLEGIMPSLLAALAVLLFSMALPFSLGLDELLNHIPYLRQFRSPGRFVWVFYVVFSVYGFILVTRLTALWKVYGKIFLWLFLCLYSRDAFMYALEMRVELAKRLHPNMFAENYSAGAPLPETVQQQTHTFQAILYLPYFHIGSEEIYIDRTWGHFGDALRYAYTTGIPLMNSMMSRTSISQSLQVTALTGHSLIPRTWPEGWQEQDILLITHTEWLPPGESYWVSRATWLADNGTHRFYRLPVSALSDTRSYLVNDFIAGKGSKYQWFEDGAYWAEAPLYFWYRNQAENGSGEPYAGKASWHLTDTGSYIADVPVRVPTEVWAEVSFWSKSLVHTNAFAPMRIELVDTAGVIYQTLDANPKESADIDGNWVRGAQSFPVYPFTSAIRISIGPHAESLIDEIVVRDTRYGVYQNVSENGRSFIFNNFLIAE